MKNLLNGGRRRQFLLIFVLTFLYKLLFAWRTGVSRGWQDELSWNTLGRGGGFFQTINQLDAGYPAPMLRAFSWVLARTTDESFLVWHLCILVAISASTASLAYSKVIESGFRYLVAGLVLSYPSFDLLLLHNLPYWTFIPLFVMLSNIFYRKLDLNAAQYSLIVFLILFTAKPQILIIVLFLVLGISAISKIYRFPFLVMSAVILFLISFGRVSNNSINLQIDFSSIFNLGITVNSHFANIVAMLLVLALYAASKILNQPLLIGFYYLATNLAFSYILYKYIRSDKREFRTLLVYFAMIIYVLSLFVFPNSGWSNNGVLSSLDFISLYSRHYLPVILIGSFLLIKLVGKTKLLFGVLIVGVLQNMAIQIVVFNQLYRPI
jgi:hypothetical protein